MFRNIFFWVGEGANENFGGLTLALLTTAWSVRLVVSRPRFDSFAESDQKI